VFGSGSQIIRSSGQARTKSWSKPIVGGLHCARGKPGAAGKASQPRSEELQVFVLWRLARLPGVEPRRRGGRCRGRNRTTRAMMCWLIVMGLESFAHTLTANRSTERTEPTGPKRPPMTPISPNPRFHRRRRVHNARSAADVPAHHCPYIAQGRPEVARVGATIGALPSLLRTCDAVVREFLASKAWRFDWRGLVGPRAQRLTWSAMWRA
jgi:hypothetical protein